MKNSYCTGENGRIANDEANEMRYGTGKAGSAALAQARGLLKAMPKKDGAASGSGGAGTTAPSPPHIGRSKLYGEADPNADIDQRKVKEALKRAAEKERVGGNDDSSGSDEEDGDNSKIKKKKRKKYHSMNAEVDMTEEEMEAYRLRKGRSSDPMGNFRSDELLEYDMNSKR